VEANRTTVQVDWETNVADYLEVELASNLVDQSRIDTCPPMRMNGRVPRGPTKGHHMAPPYYSVKFGMGSVGVEPATSRHGQSLVIGQATSPPMGSS
jgi:hypothetical protein